MHFTSNFCLILCDPRYNVGSRHPVRSRILGVLSFEMIRPKIHKILRFNMTFFRNCPSVLSGFLFSRESYSERSASRNRFHLPSVQFHGAYNFCCTEQVASVLSLFVKLQHSVLKFTMQKYHQVTFQMPPPCSQISTSLLRL